MNIRLHQGQRSFVRPLVWLLGIAVATIFLPLSSYSQSELACSPDTTRVGVLETFFIDIVVDESMLALHCFNINIDFDASLVELISVEEGSLFDGQSSFFFWDSVGDSLNILNCTLGYGSHVNGPGTIATLYLESRENAGMTGVMISIADFADTAQVPIQIPVQPVDGLIVVGQVTCCGIFTAGVTGNTNCDDSGQRNLADITRLIDRVYLSKTELCCDLNGNVNGDIDGKLNLADITNLIDHVYISKRETSACL